ncbi:MAG: hypothetical protein FJ009_16555 [Chloroflexi bacterium]|nr:hypothetical protein [Chloroflexota bacterium]
MNPGQSSPVNKLALSSLALSGIGLLAYVGISARAPFALFALATLGAWLVGIVALALAAFGARGAHQSLARVSIAVACGYLIGMSIVLLNVIVTWLRG